ncbi:nitroreductase [Frigidibacter sp. MR17.14]|uniref:nitroreductase n=1 Tax=Frigidibacter sp. MR17.14 TaxID=3126509 RepID=UPI003012CC62
MLATMAGRRSVRAFLPDPVARATIEAILDAAARAPSGSNTQPWRVTVLTGAALDRLGRRLEALALSGDGGTPEYHYYPRNWREPYLSRRRKVGWDLYTSLGINRAEKDRMATQHARNYSFFGAPVGLIFSIDRDMELGSWLDYGMFLQNLMLAARAHGLDTCPQAAFVRYPQQVAALAQLLPEEKLVCGMALGRADWADPANRFCTERIGTDTFTKFLSE